ncbi:MAG TPA: isochorismatase family cysteine hydrolase [Cellulomonas sp.]
MHVPHDHAALLVIDMQRAFLDPDAARARSGGDVTPLMAAIPGCTALVELARAADVPVIFTRYVYSAGMADFGPARTERARRRRAAGALAPDDPGIEIVDVLAPRRGEVVIDKARASAFYGTRLEPVLTGTGIRNLVICGVTTNICVESTARDAGQRDYGTFVVRDAVAELTPERHENALAAIDWYFGTTCAVADVAGSWPAAPGRS